MIDLMNWIPIVWQERIVLYKEGAYTIERVATPRDYKREGLLLAHCLGTKVFADFEHDHRVFSIREYDSGVPHATILCKYKWKRSPYGKSMDLGTNSPFTVYGSVLRVLQVRGREDKLARPEYLDIAHNWYMSCGGTANKDLHDELREWSVKHGDDDELYHFDYLYDETKGYHATKMHETAV